ncbi:MAG: zinc ribbon domain-containing protein [Candidatus Omnitrophica bacterium]|nr:zinc ribbon domain-containing protein [Candidatus Omnitrophota bacterium]
MPTYEYECIQCNKTFEIFQKITDKPLEKCPKCHQKIKRLISGGSGIIFKGSGFYATDYRKPTKNEPSKTKTASCPGSKEACRACPHAH